MSNELFSVATYEQGVFRGFLSNSQTNRTSWTRSVAQRHARQFVKDHPGNSCRIENEFREVVATIPATF